MAAIERNMHLFFEPMLQRTGYVTTKIKRQSTMGVVWEAISISLTQFQIMYEVSISSALFPGKFFNSPGISEILLIYTRSITQGFENNRPRLVHQTKQNVIDMLSTLFV